MTPTNTKQASPKLKNHRLAWDNATAQGITNGTERHWPEMMTVDYDEPMLYSKQPQATLQATQEASE